MDFGDVSEKSDSQCRMTEANKMLEKWKEIASGFLKYPGLRVLPSPEARR
jgi:hypothetical protein